MPPKRRRSRRVERLSTAQDLDAVLEIEDASFNNPTTREWYEGELKRPEVCFIYVLRTARTTSGRRSVRSGWWPIRRISTIWPFDLNSAAAALEPSCWTSIVDEARHLGAASLTLEVRRSNIAAQRLYAKSGFHEAGVRKNYYTQPVEDALVLLRKIP